MRLPTLEKVVTASMTHWITVRIVHWYGAGERRVQFTSNTAVWYHSGKPVVPIRWVLIRDPLGQFETQALLSLFGVKGKREFLPTALAAGSEGWNGG